MLKYYTYTQKPGEDVWTWSAIASFPETVYNEETLAYMSVNDIRYRVDVIGDEETVLAQRTYEPSERLKQKYKDYFLKEGDHNGESQKTCRSSERSSDCIYTTAETAGRAGS